MRMKEDHMLNGQLKPGYNFQISSNNQYIVNYSLHPTTADTTTLKEHTGIYQQQYGHLPETITADAGYGSEENYQYLKQNNIEDYVKYNYFDKEQTSKPDQKYPFKADQTITRTGFTKIITRYQAQTCNGCPLRGACHKAKGNRVIEVKSCSKKL